MKFVSVRELRLQPGKVWAMAEEEKDLIITSNGRPVAILTGVTPETLDEELVARRRARALAALDRLHKESVKKGKHRVSDGEIRTEIEAVRRGSRC